jgi:hypothetical protein
MPAGARDCGEVAQEFKRTVMATQEMMTGSNFIICREFSQAVQGLHGFFAINKNAIDAPHQIWHFCQINDGFGNSQTLRT